MAEKIIELREVNPDWWRREMPTQKTINVYTFDELDDKTKEKVIEKHSEMNVDYNWWDFIIEHFVEESDKLGINIAPNSVSFDLYRRDFSVKDNLHHLSEGDYEVNTSDELCWNRRIEYEINFIGDEDEKDELEEAFFKTRIEIIIDKFEELMKQTMKDLESEYDYQTSSEAITESIKANEYEFLEDGTIWR